MVQQFGLPRLFGGLNLRSLRKCRLATLDIARNPQGLAEGVIRPGVVRPKARGLPESGNRLIQIALLLERCSQNKPRLAVIPPEPDRLFHLVDRSVEIAGLPIRNAQPVMSFSQPRIECDGLLELGPRLIEIVFVLERQAQVI